MNPFELLDITIDATDRDVEAAYRRCLRTHAPDIDPEGFKEVRRAYELVRDEAARIHYLEFHHEPAGRLVDILEEGLKSRDEPVAHEGSEVWLAALRERP